MKSLLFAAAALTLMASVSMAAPTFGDGGWALQNLMDDVTVGGASSVDVTTDAMENDELWAIDGLGLSANVVVKKHLPTTSPKPFGIYDSTNPSQIIEVFDGSEGAGTIAYINIKLDGSVWLNFADTGIDFGGNQFGYCLVDDDPANTWYSQKSLNSDGADHMYVYDGQGDTIQIDGLAAGPWWPGGYLLAWEAEQIGLADKDYDDFVVIVESVTPIPEPTTLAILGLGSVGLLRLRKKS